MLETFVLQKDEIPGPGRLLGYRAMHAKIRQNHQLNVPTALVYAAIEDVDTNGLEYGTGTFREKSKREKASVTSERTSWVFHFDGSVTSERTNWVFHFDGLEQSMGFQNNTLSIAIYGCLDTARRKFVWIKVWDINSSPYLTARWYFDYLYESKLWPHHVRLDKGTETLHVCLQRQQYDINTGGKVIYGPSKSNQTCIRL